MAKEPEHTLDPKFGKEKESKPDAVVAALTDLDDQLREAMGGPSVVAPGAGLYEFLMQLAVTRTGLVRKPLGATAARLATANATAAAQPPPPVPSHPGVKS